MRPIEKLLNPDDGTRREFLELAAQYDTPAFIRRANRTAEAAEEVFHKAEKQRFELLELARTRLAMLGAMVNHEWERLEPILQTATPEPGQTQTTVPQWLARLHADWAPELRGSIESTESTSKLRRAVKDLASSFTRFNQRWQRYCNEFNFDHVNQIRQDYNNYYVVEKACAFDSERIGQQGFVELDPMTANDLLERHPILYVPQLR